MANDTHALYAFLRCARGDWRNALHVRCNTCPYNERPCRGYLLVADEDGEPLLIGVDVFERATGESINPLECVSVMTGAGFDSLYHRYLLWNVEEPKRCPRRQLAMNIPCV